VLEYHSEMTSLPQPHDTQPASSLSEAGAAMRDQALDVLGGRYRLLADRATRRLLTDAERTEFDRLEVSINTLQAMGGTCPD
jgi:hypothetical protein